MLSLNSLQGKLGTLKVPAKYRNHPIGILQGGDFLSLFYGISFHRLQNPSFTIVNGYVIFANQTSALKSLIDEIEAGKTLSNAAAFRQSAALINQPSFLDLYLNAGSGLNLIKAGLNADVLKQLPEHRETLNNLSSFILKIGKAKDGYQCQANLSFLKNPKREVNLLLQHNLIHRPHRDLPLLKPTMKLFR